MVPITHEQNIICTKTRLDVTTHEQTIICRQLFAGQVVGSRPTERNKKMHGMIISDMCNPSNHKNYNFLDCDWFKKLLFPTNSLVKLLSDSLLSKTLLSDSLLSDRSISQSHSKM